MSKDALILKSEYIMMRDGVRLAVSSWLAVDSTGHVQKHPAVVVTTRYWRAMAFQQDKPMLQEYDSWAAYLSKRGYVLVVADARGTGASFGFREAEIDPVEVEDIGEVIDWVSNQPWCDGRVATNGTSYSANTTLYSLVTAPIGLKVGVCRAPDFDVYRHLFAPGGIVNRWFIDAWGGITAAQDANDPMALFSSDYPVPESDLENMLGVRPVDEDATAYVSGRDSLLSAAISEHNANFNIAAEANTLTFIDNFLSEKNRPLFDPAYQQAIEKSNVPLVIRCGWHDAGTQLGALSMFASFSHHPIHVILGPWNHSGTFRVDPFQQDDDSKTAITIPKEESRALIVKSLDTVFDQRKTLYNDQFFKKPLRLVEYFTLGENCWKVTEQWPLPQTQLQRFYLAIDHQLATTPPDSQEGSDQYRVDSTTTTGLNNRWYTQCLDQPIFFSGRQEEDKKLLVYDTPPLENDTEITGHPIVHLYIRSNTIEGYFFVYLETIDPDGRVRMLTEGQLRGLHRKVSNETPPYRMFGPYHSLKEKDALPLVPGEVAEISFDLYPISVLLKKGQRIRVAIAGADADTFDLLEGFETTEIIVERNSIYASYIDLPIV